MLGQRLRRWLSIQPTLAQRLVFAGINTCPAVGSNQTWWKKVVIDFSFMKLFEEWVGKKHFVSMKSEWPSGSEPWWYPKNNCISQQTRGHSPYAISMSGQRLRRWANIETELGECPVFDGMNYTILWNAVTSPETVLNGNSVKTKFYKTPSSILHCIC